MDVNKKFGLMLGGVLLGVSIYKLIMHHQHLWLLIIFSCLLLLMSLIKPDALAPFRLAWDKVGPVNACVFYTHQPCCIGPQMDEDRFAAIASQTGWDNLLATCGTDS